MFLWVAQPFLRAAWGASEQRAKDVNRISRKRYKHRQRGAAGSFTKEDIDFLRRTQKNKCVVCREKLVAHHIDHIIPISAGGSNYRENLQLLCPACNIDKSNRHPVDYMQSRGYLL